MHSFKDNAGRSWNVVVNAATVKRVRERIGVNLVDILGGDLLQRLITDPIALADVVFAVCEPDMKKANVTSEAFGEAMAGDSIDEATKALLEAFSDFLPTTEARANLARAVDVIYRMMGRVQEAVAAKLEGVDVDRAISEISGRSPRQGE